MKTHPDFLFTATSGTYGSGDYNFIGGEMLTASELERFRFDSREYSENTARKLDEFTAEIDSIVSDTVRDLGDFAADLDEVIS